MRRRGPPSSLRLFQGPLPPRSHPKHTLPSIPHPVFRPEAFLPRGPAPAPRSRQGHLIPPLAAIRWSDSSSKRVRGPWDDASCYDFVVDVDRLPALPKPVAMGTH